MVAERAAGAEVDDEKWTWKEKETQPMLDLTKWLRENGASPLCAIRLATKSKGQCACSRRTPSGVRATCDEMARSAWVKKGAAK